MKMHEVRAQSLHELRTQKRLTANSDFDPPADSQQIQNHDEVCTVVCQASVCFTNVYSSMIS